jgi:hypothetical protein
MSQTTSFSPWTPSEKDNGEPPGALISRAREVTVLSRRARQGKEEERSRVVDRGFLSDDIRDRQSSSIFPVAQIAGIPLLLTTCVYVLEPDEFLAVLRRAFAVIGAAAATTAARKPIARQICPNRFLVKAVRPLSMMHKAEKIVRAYATKRRD